MKIPFQAKSLGADLISVSSHKVHGPKGVGALYISPRFKSFPALMLGGGQENGFRSGTEATPAIAGFGTACRVCHQTFHADIQQESNLLQSLIDKVEAFPEIVISGAHQAPHILCLSIPGVPTQNTINILQDEGICVSAGSACAKGHRSHVLSAMNLSPQVIDGSFRISLSRETTQADIDALVLGLQRVLAWKNRS